MSKRDVERERESLAIAGDVGVWRRKEKATGASGETRKYTNTDERTSFPFSHPLACHRTASHVRCNRASCLCPCISTVFGCFCRRDGDTARREAPHWKQADPRLASISVGLAETSKALRNDRHEGCWRAARTVLCVVASTDYRRCGWRREGWLDRTFLVPKRSRWSWGRTRRSSPPCRVGGQGRAGQGTS
jgi:hypothetical protein